MRTDFDGAAYDRWLWREADRYWGGEEEEPEETADEARERMTEEERRQDLEWEKEN